MAMGPHEQKLREAVGPAAKAQVDAAQREWARGARLLDAVAAAIQGARDSKGADSLGDLTREQARAAFEAMHVRVARRAEEMQAGAQALLRASDALSDAESVRDSFDAQGPLTRPSSPQWSDDEVEQIRQLKVHNQQVAGYQAQYDARERAALEATRQMDQTYRESTSTMERIHGDKPSDGGGGGGAGAAGGGGAGGAAPAGTSRAPEGGVRGPIGGGAAGGHASGGAAPASAPGQASPGFTTVLGTDPGVPQGGGGPAASPSAPTGLSAQSGSPSGGSTLGGVAGALGGAMIGGAAGIGGAVRGGSSAFPTGATGSSTNSGRSIGASSRTGTSGALGRGGAAPGSAGSTAARPTPTGRTAGPAGTSGSPTTARGAGAPGGRSGAALTAGAPGQRGGAAGAPGGRGAAAGTAGASGAARGSRRTGKAAKGDRDFYDDGHDWVDDEGVAPGLLD